MCLVGRRDQSTYINTISFSLVHNLSDYMGFEPANFFFFSPFYAWVLVNQFIFSPTIFPPAPYICTTQPGFESSLDHFHDWFVFGIRHDLANLKMTTQNLHIKCWNTYDCSTLFWPLPFHYTFILVSPSRSHYLLYLMSQSHYAVFLLLHLTIYI